MPPVTRSIPPWQALLAISLVLSFSLLMSLDQLEGTLRIAAVAVIVGLPTVISVALLVVMIRRPHLLYAPDVSDPQAAFSQRVRELADSASDKLKGIIESQLNLLADYHGIVLANARRSFVSAWLATVLWLAFFLGAVLLVLFREQSSPAIIAAVGGGLAELIAGANFLLYSRASSQRSAFHSRLERFQQVILADSISSELPEDSRVRAKLLLVQALAGVSSSEVYADSSRTSFGGAARKEPGSESAS